MDRALFTHLISWVVYCLLLYGISKRREKISHRRIMISAFVLDISLVLFIELGREAVAQALEFPSGWLGIHIIFSIITIVLYVVMVILGQRLFKGDETIRGLHKKMAWVFMFFKTFNLITSYLF